MSSVKATNNCRGGGLYVDVTVREIKQQCAEARGAFRRRMPFHLGPSHCISHAIISHKRALLVGFTSPGSLRLQAVKAIEEVASTINTTAHEIGNILRVARIQKDVFGDRINLVTDTRSFVHEGDVRKVSEE